MDHSFVSSFRSPSQNNVPHENSIENNAAFNDVVALNKILHNELIRTKEFIESHRIIIRCDELPILEGSHSDFEKLFQGIIHLIVDHPVVNSKQLLYIQCKEDEVNKDVINLSDKVKTYTIQFHTNIALEPYWQITHHTIIKECEQIAAKYNGSLIINNISSGCLFTLHLSGKPL